MANPIFRLSDLCPCGSGRTIADCCIAARCNTVPPEPHTDYANPKCYARALHDCSKTISGEHYISDGILQQISDEGQILVAGLPRTETGNFKQIAAKTLKPRILCTRHNEALSTLDTLASKFFRFLDDQSPQDNLLFVNGDEFERWMLKVLCGLAASGSLIFDNQKIKDWEPPSSWLEILFGSAPGLPAGGLYYIYSRKPIGVLKKGIRLDAARNPASGAIEIALVIHGLPFLFAMEWGHTTFQSPETTFELLRRPRSIHIIDGRVTKTIHTGWLTGKDITIQYPDSGE